MDDGKVHDAPSEVSADEGVVMVDGPDGVAVSLTPDAAEETSERLFQESLKARTQKSEEPESDD